MNQPTEKRCTPWLTGVTTTTSFWTSVRPRSWWWIFRRQTSEHPHLHRRDSIGAGQQHQVPRHKHHWGPHLEYSHMVSSKEGPPVSLLPRATKEFQSEFKNPQAVLQLHCGEHPAWLNGTALNQKALYRIVQMAQHIVGGELPSLQDIYTQRRVRKTRKIIRDSCQLSHELFSLLPSGRRYHSIRTRTSRTRDSFFLQAIRLLNSR